MDQRVLHPRALTVTVVWTPALLLPGSVAPEPAHVA